jgi:hypothetical protein
MATLAMFLEHWQYIPVECRGGGPALRKRCARVQQEGCDAACRQSVRAYPVHSGILPRKLRPGWLHVARIVFGENQREAAAAPSFIASGERPNSRDSFAAKQKREPSGRHLIRAGAK